MKYSMSIDREVYVVDENWTLDVLRISQEMRNMFSQSAVQEAFALMRKVNSDLTSLYGRTLKELLEAPDYQQWAALQAEDLFEVTLSECRAESESWLSVHMTLEIDVYALKTRLEELSTFLIEKRHVPFKEGVLTFWEWYPSYLSNNPPISPQQFIVSGRQGGKTAYVTNAGVDWLMADWLKMIERIDESKHQGAAEPNEIRPYPDFSEEDAKQGRIEAGVQPLLEAGRKTCLWVSSTFNESCAAYDDVCDVYVADITHSSSCIRQIQFNNGSSIRFTFVDYLDTLRGTRSDYIVLDDVPSIGCDEMKRLLARATTDGSAVIALFKEEDSCESVVFDEALAISKKDCLALLNNPPPFPGGQAAAAEDNVKTEPLQPAPELRSVFGWLCEDRACTFGAYEIIPTDLGTFHILQWGMMNYCAMSVDDLKAYAKNIEDEAWMDSRENPLPIDQEVWCTSATS